MEFLKYITGMSITGSIIFFIFLSINPFTKKNFNSSWHYKMSIIILVFFVLPIGSFIEIPPNLRTSLIPAETIKTNIAQSEDIKKTQEIENIKVQQPKYQKHEDSTKIENEVYNKLDSNKNKFKFNFNKNIIFYAWIVGMITLFLLKMNSYIKFKANVLRDSIEIKDAYILEIFNMCRSNLKIKRRIPLRYCANISSPMLMGILNPIILIPNIDKDGETLRMIFLHELNHYRRKDILIKHFGFLINIIHWFNPISYIALKKMDMYCEYSIDEKVVGQMGKEERKYYCEAILKLMDNSIIGRTLTTSMGTDGKRLKSRLENIIFFRKDSKKRYIKSIFALTIILISGFIISCSIIPKSIATKYSPIISYIKTDGLYFTYLDDEEIKIHEGSGFSDPIISKTGDYIAYTKDNNLYIYDIENNKFEEIDKEIVSYDWIDNESLVYSTNNSGFTKFNYKNKEEVALKDDYYYNNFKSSNNKLYGKRIIKWSTSEGDFQYTEGIVEIDLKTNATNIIIEGKKSTDEMIGYAPTIWDISDDGRYIYIMEKFASGSLSADIGGIGVYDVKEKTHIDLSNIFGNKVEDLTVIPRKNNIAINPKNNNLISVIKGSGREMVLDKEVILLDINKDKTYKTINFMDKNLVAMTPSFTKDGKRLLYSATTTHSSNPLDHNDLFESWYNQPHNIYEYDLNTTKVKKVTDGDSFDFMPTSISKNTILFIRYKDEQYSLIKLNKGKEEIVAENIIFENQFYGYIYTETSMDILYNGKEFNLIDNKDTDNMSKLYEMKGTKIGDNSKVSKILSLIEFPEGLSGNGIELFTKEEPYGLQVNFKGNIVSLDEEWKSQSLILFSLIDNLDYIKYFIDDGKGNTAVSNVDRKSADSITISVLGVKASEIAKSKKAFKDFYDIFGN